MKYLLPFLLLILPFIYGYKLEKFVNIAPRAGSVSGIVETSRNGQTYYAFKGIPYAEPPVGALRWRDPVAKLPWDGILDASKEGPECHQIFFSDANGTRTVSEDCLHLSVAYRPTGQLKPVIVNIHGGGFVTGSNSFENYSPAYLMDYDVVFVSINYRLGPLGFLSSGTVDATGNYGLKDQVLALQWIQTNIIAFEGDASQVTIIGHSAGSISVGLHVLSPMSQGLFKAAIPMSGAPTFHEEFAHDNANLLERMAELTGCDDVTSTGAVIECLRTLPADLISDTTYFFFEAGGLCPISVWGPTIERNFGQRVFINSSPESIIQSGNFNKVPILTGIARDEFAVYAYLTLLNDVTRYQLNYNFEDIAPICFVYERDTDRSRYISSVLKQNFIPNYLENNDESLTSLQPLFGDSIIGFPKHRFVQLLWNQVNVFYYKISYVGRFSSFLHPGNEPWGVEHGDCIMYVLENRNVMPGITSNDAETITIERMTRMWVNFAYTGNPNNPNDEYIGNINWTPYNGNEHNYLDIGDDLAMKEGLFLERYDIWDELFPISG